MASVTLPQLRLRWLDEGKKECARALLYEYVSTVQRSTDSVPEQCSSVTESASQKDDFFCFDSQPSENPDARAEVDMFVTVTSRDIDCLHKFPHIKNLFLRYNTPLPSSAPVERLFILRGQILTPRRNRMTPAHFERQLLLRANKWLMDSKCVMYSSEYI